MNNLEKCLDTLNTGNNEILINNQIIDKAKNSIQRLLDFTK
jgi:quinolinate synthase